MEPFQLVGQYKMELLEIVLTVAKIIIYIIIIQQCLGEDIH